MYLVVIIDFAAKVAFSGGGLASDEEHARGPLGKFYGLPMENALPVERIDIIAVAGRVARSAGVSFFQVDAAAFWADGQQSVVVFSIRPDRHNVAAAVTDGTGASVGVVVLPLALVVQLLPCCFRVIHRLSFLLFGVRWGRFSSGPLRAPDALKKFPSCFIRCRVPVAMI